MRLLRIPLPFSVSAMLMSAAVLLSAPAWLPAAEPPPAGATASALASRDLHVDPAQGDDTADGIAKPVKTIARAIRLAQPGDTVHLAKAVYHETVDLTNKRGEPGRPVTIDGHGAKLEGSEPVLAKDWEALGGGLFRKVRLMPKMDAAILGRWFFLWDGKINHMGRSSKGTHAPLKKVEALAPGEWTYVEAEDAFYLKLPEGQALDAANIRYPARSNGVALGGKCAHVVVRNILATHVYNDGYNIHGDVRDAVFQNIAAIDCGDDGFSAHETAECTTDAFVSMGNSTGICDTVSSVTHFRNVFIRGCLGYDVFFIGNSPHSIENAVIESSALRPLEVAIHTDRPQEGTGAVLLKNVAFTRMPGASAAPGSEVRVSRNAKLTLERCTFHGLNFIVSAGGEIEAHLANIDGFPRPTVQIYQAAKWHGTENWLALASFRWGPKTWTAATFADFQKELGSDGDSAWPEAGLISIMMRESPGVQGAQLQEMRSRLLAGWGME